MKWEKENGKKESSEQEIHLFNKTEYRSERDLKRELEILFQLFGFLKLKILPWITNKLQMDHNYHNIALSRSL